MKLKTEKNYTLEFTEKEYLDLIKTIYLADWIANATTVYKKDKCKYVERVRNIILLQTAGTNLENYTEFDSNNNDIDFGQILDDDKDLRSIIDRYDEEIFWQELVGRLSKRDTFRNISQKDYAKMDMIERISLDCESEESWHNEFEKHGIERLAIDINKGKLK